MNKSFWKVGVVARQDSRAARELARELAKWLERRGHEVVVDGGEEAGPTRPALATEPPCDLLVVLGGDGTLLSVARHAAGGAPLFGVNLGRLGFLTEVAREELYPALVAVLAGNYRLERRSLLEVEVERKGSALGRFRALNDAVVAKSAPSRIIELRLLLDGRLLSRYRADGLVVATPTGSTAYSLSAGGPILEPGLPVMVLTPICPHALTLRPVVVPDTATVEVGVEAGGSDRVYLTVDGQEGMELESGDRVVVRRAPAAVTLVRTSESLSWLEGLRSKLRWGE